MEVHQIVISISLFILIILSACFSSSETAFLSVSGIRLKSMAKDGNAKAELAYKVYRNSTALLTSILIGNNIVNILATSLATLLFSELYGGLGVLIATTFMTVFILVIGEITPKIIAQTKPEAVCMVMARPLSFVVAFLKPITYFVVKLQSSWESKAGIKKVTATEDELLEIVSTIEQEGVIVQDERELIESVIEFDDTNVKEVMIEYDKVSWIYDDISIRSLKSFLKKNKHSRFPVVSRQTNKVIGILKIRDVLERLLSNEKIVIKDLMSDALFVSQYKKLPQILDDIQKSFIHMAIVSENAKSDNFIGIVTLEDVLEELVGEIYDEFDPLPEHVVEYGHHSFDVDGKVNLKHFFNEYLEDYDFPNTKAKNITNWVKEIAQGKVRKGREIEFENYEIKVLATKEGLATKINLTVSTALEDEYEE